MRMLIAQHAPSRHDNPFATCWTRPGAIPFRFPVGSGADQFVAKLRDAGWWGEVIGPHGSGKSTLLETLKPRLEAAGRTVHQIRLGSRLRRVPSTQLPRPFINALTSDGVAGGAQKPKPSELLLVIDGYEQLGWFARRQIKRFCMRASAGLLVTAHRSMGFPHMVELTPDRRLIEQLVSDLCAKLPGCISPSDIAASHASHGSNVREIFFDLYDRHERLRRAM